MRDGLPLIGLDLFKGTDHYQITEMYATCLNKTYVGVRKVASKTTINYEFSSLLDFLKRNGFSVKESVKLEYFLT